VQTHEEITTPKGYAELGSNVAYVLAAIHRPEIREYLTAHGLKVEELDAFAQGLLNIAGIFLTEDDDQN